MSSAPALQAADESGYPATAGSPPIWPDTCAVAGFPFWDLEKWELKEAFAGVLTNGRVAQVQTIAINKRTQNLGGEVRLCSICSVARG